MMLTPMNVLSEKAEIISTIVDRLSRVPNLVAIALGGSFASGRARATSDLDFGLYYREDSPFSVDDIQRVARTLSDQAHPAVTDFYQWGPWVNGGAWITTRSGKVDFLYRNLDQVERTISEAEVGESQHHYGQQPPYGFYSVIYLAEIKIAIPLLDPDGQLDGLKTRVSRYPSKLKSRIVNESLWSAEFTLKFAESAAAATDLYGTVGCITRVLANLTQVLFAMNDEYFLTDKRLAQVLATFSKLPAGYVARMERILSKPGEDAETLTATVDFLRKLWTEVVALTDGEYRSHYSA